MTYMDPIRDPFWLENIERARHQSMEQKLLDGGELFDMACAVTMSGIRWQNPGISDADALDILRKRLVLAKKTESLLSEIVL